MPMIIELAACTNLPRFCVWSGVSSDAILNSETGHQICPKCRGPVTTWKVDQSKEMAALRREQDAAKAQWWKGYEAREAALARERIASDGAKMRGRVSADVIARRGGGKYAREERQHLQELIKRALAEREG